MFQNEGFANYIHHIDDSVVIYVVIDPLYHTNVLEKVKMLHLSAAAAYCPMSIFPNLSPAQLYLQDTKKHIILHLQRQY